MILSIYFTLAPIHTLLSLFAALKCSQVMLTIFLVNRVPIFHIQSALGPSTKSSLDFIETRLGYSPDASRPQTPFTKYDWEGNPPWPTPAYVVATPDEYEKSTDAAQKECFVVGMWPPREVVRLKEAVAREHGLQSVWTHAAGNAEGRMAFFQNWATITTVES